METELRKGRRKTRFRAALAMMLATALVASLNVLCVRLYYRGPVAHHLHGSLSERTVDLLRQIDGSVELIGYFEESDPLWMPVKATLENFEMASEDLPSLRIRAWQIDPNRNAAEAAELDRRHGDVPVGSILVRTPAGTDSITLCADDLSQSDPGRSETGDTVDFVGEARIVKAIWNVTRAAHPAVLFLSGTGEYDPGDFDKQSGYSSVAQALRQDLYPVRTLDLSRPDETLPPNSVLVVAGPRAKLPVRTIETLGDYLSGGGRLLLLLGDAPDPGLAGLLQRWGATVAPPSPGAHSGTTPCVISASGPIAGALSGVPPTLGISCRIRPTAEALASSAVDKPHADVLLRPRLSRGAVVRPPPASAAPPAEEEALAVTIERGGPERGSKLPPTRIVVVGDSAFASNGMTDAGYDQNIAFFLACVHWLAESDVFRGNPPVTFRVLRSGIGPGRWPATIALVVVVWPLAVLLFGRLFYVRKY